MRLPVYAGTPLPPPLEDISAESAVRVQQLARWGTGDVWDVVPSPDGSTLAVSSSNGITLYDANTLDERQVLQPAVAPGEMAFSPDGTMLASGAGYRDHRVWLWRVGDGQLVHTLGLYARTPPTLTFSPNGATLAVGFEPPDSSSYMVQIWGVPEE